MKDSSMIPTINNTLFSIIACSLNMVPDSITRTNISQIFRTITMFLFFLSIF